MMITRRTLLGAGLAVTTLGPLAACSDDSAGDVAEPLRFGFWGNDLRTKAFGEVVTLFEQTDAGTDVVTETGTFDAYFQRLAVQTAGNDAPDVISMDIAYFSEYAGRGALADLSGHGVRTGDFPSSLVDSGKIDGQLLGLAHGMGAAAMMANPAALDQSGVELPEDASWTWEQLISVAGEITQASQGKIIGLGGRTFTQALAFQSFLAERDLQTFTADGAVGFTADDLASWSDIMTKAQRAKAIAAPQAVVEEGQLDVDRSGLATGTIAIDTWWSNQLTAMNSASGTPLQLLHPPSQGGTTPPVVLQPTVYWTVSSRSKQPDLAVALINFFTGDPAAAKIIGTDRGLPGNAKARAAIADQLTDADPAAAAFVGDDANATFTPFPPPVGGSELGEIYGRHATDVMFRRKSPAEAATAVLAEVGSAIKAS